MSRSFKKTKIRGITGAATEKEEKRDANRKLRRIVKQKMKKQNTEFPLLREISNVWSFSKDGKNFYPGMSKKQMRK